MGQEGGGAEGAGRKRTQPLPQRAEEGSPNVLTLLFVGLVKVITPGKHLKIRTKE